MTDCIPIRASSLGELFDCPARWEAKHLLGMRLPVSDAARLGTAVHAGTALFDQSRLEEKPLTIDDCAGAVVDVIYGKDEEVNWEDSTPNEAEKIAVPLHKLYCEKIAPKQDYVAVEALCDDLTITDLGITLTGTVDRVRKTDEGYGVTDLKTGKTAVDADGFVKVKGHAMQLGVYEILASHALNAPVEAPAQIVGLQTAKTDKGRRVGIGEINEPKNLLLDSDDGSPGLLRHAARLVHSGDFYGNSNSCLCSEKYCPIFRVCKWRK